MKGFDDCPCCKILEGEIKRLRAWNYRLLQRADAAQAEVERLAADNIHKRGDKT